MFMHHLDVLRPWPLLRPHLQHHPAERHNVRLEEPDATKKRNHRRYDEGGVPLGRRRGQLRMTTSPSKRSSGCGRLQVPDRGGDRGSGVHAAREAAGRGGRWLGRAGGRWHEAPACGKRWAEAAGGSGGPEGRACGVGVLEAMGKGSR
jgi:hypothetical protein